MAWLLLHKHAHPHARFLAHLQLAVQVVEVCMAKRSLNGGIMDIEGTIVHACVIFVFLMFCTSLTLTHTHTRLFPWFRSASRCKQKTRIKSADRVHVCIFLIGVSCHPPTHIATHSHIGTRTCVQEGCGGGSVAACRTRERVSCCDPAGQDSGHLTATGAQL